MPPEKTNPKFRKCYTIDGIDHEFDTLQSAVSCADDLLSLGAPVVTIHHRLVRTDIEAPQINSNPHDQVVPAHIADDPNLHPFAG